MDIKNDYKLLVYGDSITRGIVYDEEKRKYITLKDSFANIVADKVKGTVYNAGRFGNTIIRGISKMYNEVMKKDPDIVLIEFGGNDCDFDWDDVAHNPDIEHKPNTDLTIFRETLLNMINTLKDANIVPALMTLPPLDYKRYFKWISKGEPFAAQNILHWLGSEEKIYTWHASYNQMIADVAKETKTLLIDVREKFIKFGDYSKLLCEDGIHPNVEGHNLIAKVFLNFLSENYNFLLQE